MEILPTAGCLALAASGDYIPTKKIRFSPVSGYWPDKL